MNNNISRYDLLIECYRSGQIEPHDFVFHMDNDEVFKQYVFKRMRKEQENES